MNKLVEKVFARETFRNAVVEGVCKGLRNALAGSDNLNPFRLLEDGKLNNFLFIFFTFFICLARFSSIWASKNGVNVSMDLYYEFISPWFFHYIKT